MTGTNPKASEPRRLLNALTLVYRPVVNRVARQTLQGRCTDLARPEAGRFLRSDVTAFLDDIWRRMPGILAEGNLDAIPTTGSKHNAFLAALTVAAYQALLDAGVERDYAMELVADVGWKLYERMATAPMAVARLLSKDPQRRAERVLKWFLAFPFSAPGRPGYEVNAWSEPGRFYTYWTYCAPLSFVRAYVRQHGDRGEVEAFYRSWCHYDWPLADILAGGKAGERNHYERPHTLSRGDAVCDMCFHAVAAQVTPSQPSHHDEGVPPLRRR